MPMQLRFPAHLTRRNTPQGDDPSAENARVSEFYRG